MMPNCHTIVQQLSTYCMLNASSVPSSGLYNGRAGLALALFQYAKKNEDAWVEDEAFELLQQSLLAEVTDLSLECGLAGIGYVLLYLIENHLVDADFEEVFGKKHRLIMDSCGQLNNGDSIVRHALVVHYLYGHYRFLGLESSWALAQRIASLTTDYLMSLMASWEAASMFEKESVKLEKTMTDYVLLSIHYSELYDLDLAMDRYLYLERSGLLRRNDAVRLVSGMIGSSSEAELGLLSLRDMINLAVIERKLWNTRFWDNELFAILNGENRDALLANRVHGKQYLPGYGFGLARLLLYLTVLEEQETGRFPNFV